MRQHCKKLPCSVGIVSESYPEIWNNHTRWKSVEKAENIFMIFQLLVTNHLWAWVLVGDGSVSHFFSLFFTAGNILAGPWYSYLGWSMIFVSWLVHDILGGIFWIQPTTLCEGTVGNANRNKHLEQIGFSDIFAHKENTYREYMANQNRWGKEVKG